MMKSQLAPLAGWQVLVVEDEFLVADDVSRALSKLGATVLGPIPTVEKALGLTSDGVPLDVAVLDINLRGRSGFAAAVELLRQDNPLRVYNRLRAGLPAGAMSPNCAGHSVRWRSPPA